MEELKECQFDKKEKKIRNLERMDCYCKVNAGSAVCARDFVTSWTNRMSGK